MIVPIFQNLKNHYTPFAMEILFFAVGAIAGGVLLWALKKGEIVTLKAEGGQTKEKEEAFGEAKKEITKLTENVKNEWAQNKKLEEKNESLQGKCSELERKISQFEESKERKEKEFDKRVNDLNKAKEALEDEKNRIRREDNQRLEKAEEERDRVWNDHENLVLASLRESCQKKEIGFQFYDNANLPPDFSGALKPDFLVEFLDQYIVFDAKKSKNPKTYIREQVKETAKKLKNNNQIYPVVFFIMPVNEIAELKETSFFEGDYSFYVIPEISVGPLLANFKKITEYEKVQELDPQDRENIVNLIAGYDRHISFQNAVNILLAKDSIDLMESKERNLNEELLGDIEIKKQNMRKKLKEADINKLQNIDRQHKEISKIVEPEPGIKEKDIDEARNSLPL